MDITWEEAKELMADRTEWRQRVAQSYSIPTGRGMNRTEQNRTEQEVAHALSFGAKFNDLG